MSQKSKQKVVLDAALKLCKDRGHTVTIREIALKVGCTRRTVTKHLDADPRFHRDWTAERDENNLFGWQTCLGYFRR